MSAPAAAAGLEPAQPTAAQYDLFGQHNPLYSLFPSFPIGPGPHAQRPSLFDPQPSLDDGEPF
jgi:hypothetical protein